MTSVIMADGQAEALTVMALLTISRLIAEATVVRRMALHTIAETITGMIHHTTVETDHTGHLTVTADHLTDHQEEAHHMVLLTDRVVMAHHTEAAVQE